MMQISTRTLSEHVETLNSRITSTAGAINERIDTNATSFTERITQDVAHMMDRLKESEANRNEALKAAATTIQNGLDKAERQLQVALGTAQNDLRIALADAEKRVNEKLDVKEMSVVKMEATINDRFLRLDRFQEQILGERALYVTRDQLADSVKIISAQVQPMEQRQAFASGWLAAAGAVFGVIASSIIYLIVQVATHALLH
jgi:hypothetical protein